MKSSNDYLRDAFQAILRGDYAERDRLVEQCQRQMAVEARVAAGGPLMVGEPICLPDRSRERLN